MEWRTGSAECEDQEINHEETRATHRDLLWIGRGTQAEDPLEKSGIQQNRSEPEGVVCDT